MKDPEYRAVEVVKSKVREVTVVAMPKELKTMALEVNAQTAPEMVAPLSATEQPVTAESAKADVKLSEMSKLLLKEVMALSCSWYWDAVDLAVSGEAAAEAIVKLTCECPVPNTQARSTSQDRLFWTIGFIPF